MEKRVKSTVPIYVIGVVFVLYSLFFTLNSLHIIIASLLAFVAYKVTSKIIPQKTIVVEEKLNFVKTGKQDIDTIIMKCESFINDLRRFEKDFEQLEFNKKIKELIKVSLELFYFYSKNHDSISSAFRKFINYYFPKTVSLLSDYKDIQNRKIKTKDMIDISNRIELVVDKITDAFKTHLNNCYSNKTMDINTDIEVLEMILKEEGLS